MTELLKYVQFGSLIILLLLITSCISDKPASPDTTPTPPPASIASANSVATPINTNQTTSQEPVTAVKVKGFVYESFDGVSQIYYMKKNSPDRVKLGQSVNSQPSWSPDGNTIAFVSDIEGTSQIFKMDINGNNVTQLTSSIVDRLKKKLDVLNPIWSPDGKRIAFLSKVTSRYFANGIYIINSDGTSISNMIGGWNFAPTWSPDSKRLVFISCDIGINNGSTDIYITNAEGTELNNITNTLEDSQIGPCWSPDGHHIAFLSNREGGNIYSDCWNLYVMKDDGSEVKKLNRDGIEWAGYAGRSKNYPDANPGPGTASVWNRMNEMYGPYTTWSPDGKFITVCTVRAAGPSTSIASYPLVSMTSEQFMAGSLTIFDANTGEEITTVKAGKRSVCWSPDSKRICYIPASNSVPTDQLVPYRQAKARDLTIMDADGGNPQTIFDCAPEGYLNWHP